ncbi:uncharacterized protein EHS24_005808 [Apiotrichum porosum]|uniref:Uncharacterized protein n=1 Tax=Apiotrichum porosum TaxID=105984 RepID=A0A427XZQ5_9TREE|nr:uncharacterized protein EHS24_005808 [Apiotrichum porosum]RSH84293.1 hypothetical protein EHS24_005808 [Apiotrichum porosum]
MSFSVGNLIHRTMVFGCIGFGVYGTVVITQNLIVKSQRLKEFEAEQAAGTVSPTEEAPALTTTWRK